METGRSLLADLARTFVAILVGSVLGGALETAVEPSVGSGPSRWAILFTLRLATPVVLMAFFLFYGVGFRGRAIARFLGAVAGWLAVVAILAVPEVGSWTTSMYWWGGPGLVLFVTALIVGSFAGIGMVGCDRLWLWLRRERGVQDR